MQLSGEDFQLRCEKVLTLNKCFCAQTKVCGKGKRPLRDATCDFTEFVTDKKSESY